MRRKTAAVLVFVLLFAATCLAQLNMLPRWVDFFNGKTPSTPSAEREARDSIASANKMTPQASASPPASANTPPSVTPSKQDPAPGIKPGLDIARISRDGPSVFAGKSAPGSRVTVMDGTKEVATATANDSGDWSTVTDYKFANTNPDIQIKTQEPSAAIAPSETKPPPAPSVPPSPSVAMMQSFEATVAAAREDAKNGNAPGVLTATPAAAPTVTPVPMTFFYDQDVLTPDGRHSTELLLEYLKLKHFASVTLTGHADERGTPDYNMDLSRKRLDTILRRLRDGGYQGKLNLVPKGSSEPFKGIDRAQFAKEELMQLDRRVELRGAE